MRMVTKQVEKDEDFTNDLLNSVLIMKKLPPEVRKQFLLQLKGAEFVFKHFKTEEQFP